MTSSVAEWVAGLVPDAVDRVLDLAATWLAWDGTPAMGEGGGRLYTPHKAIRRVADHLLDHLAEIEALLAGEPTRPDGWHASYVSSPADFAPFTEQDLNEARQRLSRLADLYRIKVQGLDAEAVTRPLVDDRNVRSIVEHVASSWYAEQVGSLGR